MNLFKHRWAYSLVWINLAVALVFLILVAGNQLSNARALLHVLIYMLVYANLTGMLGTAVMGRLAEKVYLSGHSLVPFMAVATIAVTALGCLLAQTLLMKIGFVVPQHFWHEYLHTLGMATPLSLVFCFGAMAYGSMGARVLQMEKQLHDKQVAEERTQKLAAEAQLRSLESRIHPHFLFNTLNSISALVGVNPPRAQQIVGRLSLLLRASLDSSLQPLIPLCDELAMVESYIDIEKVRFGDKLRGSVNVPADLLDAKVPPMSVQSLVENAVKHGVTPLSGGGEFLVTASAEQDNLRIEVRDTGPGFDLTAIPAGHGLDSLVQRLDTLFGAKARLNVLRRDGYSVVEMVVPRL
jgi:signal transduction histidine kinase